MTKKVAVLFSGGLDSTYLVWKNLTEGNTVQPIYIEIENNKDKSIIEKNRTKLLREKFAEDFNTNCTLIREVENVATIHVSSCFNDLHFKQVPIWLFGILYSQCIGVDEIQIGYVCNDDAIPYLADIQKIYKSYASVTSTLLPLRFPITKKKKYEMADELPSKYRDLIYSCECPKIIGSPDADFVEYEPCCECVPCSHIIESDYYGLRHFPDNYKKNLLAARTRALRREGYKIFDEKGNEYQSPYELLKPEPYQLQIPFDYYNNCITNKAIEDKISKAAYRDYLVKEVGTLKSKLK